MHGTQTRLVDEFVSLLVAKGEADPLFVPPFSPGFFARGQMSQLRNIYATSDLRWSTTDIENCRPVVLFGAEPSCQGAMHGTQISPLNELVTLLMPKAETDPLPELLVPCSFVPQALSSATCPR